jgi:hypothetical protein
MTGMLLEQAIRKSYGIDKCVLIPHWDRKPRVARIGAPWERGVIRVVSTDKCMASSRAAPDFYSQYP